MKILITGICGFLGTHIAKWLKEGYSDINIFGIDNLSRPGCHINRRKLQSLGVKVLHGDLRCASDLDLIPTVDWVWDAAALPSVLAGVDNKVTPRQLMEHNLLGTVNILEYCRKTSAGLVLISTSRCYSTKALSEIPIKVAGNAFELDTNKPAPSGISLNGISLEFPTTPPVSLYGSSKLASEKIALEYGSAFSFPVIVDRCGVLAGAGQFGTAEQGIFSFWINAYLRRHPLKYIGFGGYGRQVRDFLHPDDLCELIWRQIKVSGDRKLQVYNVGGGPDRAMSLAELSEWCQNRFGEYNIGSENIVRPFDAPWIVMDNSDACKDFGWQPNRSKENILSEIADHAVAHPDWLELSKL